MGVASDKESDKEIWFEKRKGESGG